MVTSLSQCLWDFAHDFLVFFLCSSRPCTSCSWVGLLWFVKWTGDNNLFSRWDYAIACNMGSRLLLNMFKHHFRQQTSTLQSTRIAGQLLSSTPMQILSAGKSWTIYGHSKTCSFLWRLANFLMLAQPMIVFVYYCIWVNRSILNSFVTYPKNSCYSS